MDIAEVGFEFGDGFALGEVVGKGFEVAEPHLVVAPVGVGRGCHRFDASARERAGAASGDTRPSGRGCPRGRCRCEWDWD